MRSFAPEGRRYATLMVLAAFASIVAGIAAAPDAAQNARTAVRWAKGHIDSEEGVDETPSEATERPVVDPAPPPEPDRRDGYRLITKSGREINFGGITNRGGVPVAGLGLVAAAATPSGNGYWAIDAEGGVFAVNAPFHGSLPELGVKLNSPATSILPTATGAGYLIVARDGGMFAFGDARIPCTFTSPPGSLIFDAVITGSAVISFGHHGTWTRCPGGPAGPVKLPNDWYLNGRLVGAESRPSGGYWLAASDGAVFAYDGAPFLGSLPSLHVEPAGRVVAITGSPDGNGYWLASSVGGVYAFGTAPHHGSMTGSGMPLYYDGVVSVVRGSG